MYSEQTIAAISTPQGTGGIGIIRISGEKAFDIAATLFKGKKAFEKIKSHTISYGKIIDPLNDQVVDEVLISKMKKPNTFTKEDLVEINCHGGLVVVKNILELVVRAGASLAEPGEFTKRAFLNGRIDLSQAEAVIDLINAKTNESSKAAINQLEGKLSQKLKAVRSILIELIAHIEVTVDYPEEDIEEMTGEKAYRDLINIEQMLISILKGYEQGRVIREGISVAIIGRPNVGKSSLMNELSGKNKAIVTEIPGTTRDIIEEYVNIGGIPVCLVDTAGIRETADVVEKIGVERAEKALSQADLIIFMLDADQGIRNEDIGILDKVKEKKMIILLNKIDIAQQHDILNITEKLKDKIIIKTSLKEGIGIDILENEITKLFLNGEISVDSDILLSNVRHKTLIDKALESVKEAQTAYEAGMPLDCITIDVKNTAEYLGQITGESVSEDVMHKIFSRFCIGK